MPDVDLTTTKLTIAELFKITCSDPHATIAYFTNHDTNISYDGQTWLAIPIWRGPVKYGSDLEVDQVNVSFGIVSVTIGTKSYTVPQLIRRGFFRDATVEIFIVDYANTSLTAKNRFKGYVSRGIKFNKGITTLGCGSMLDRLKDKIPKIIHSEFCQHALFDAYCSLTKASYKVSTTADSGSTTTRIYSSSFAYSAHLRADGQNDESYWVQGEILGTSGDNEDFSRSIIAHGDGWIEVMFPFDHDVAGGDGFDVWPGCDGNGETCEQRFDNYDNSLLFEDIPKPEQIFG
jgi:uncharacterized phage protein (TIGR02218 family)